MAKSYRTIEIEQQCKYGFTKELVNKLMNEWDSVKDYAYIEHDKDVKEDGTPKEKHIHLMLRFNSPVPADAIVQKVNKVAFDLYKQDGVVIKDNNLQKCKTWNGAIAYLTHANAIEKYQYDDGDVISNYDWQADKKEALEVIKDKRLRALIHAIEKGELTRYNYVDKITISEYVMYKRKLEDAWIMRDAKQKHELLSGEVDMRVIYISGESGCGKTTYAKQICDGLGYTYCISGGSNDPLQDYAGEDALILDDLRGSTFRFADFLKMTDHNTRSSVNSRYFNKFLFVKLIIITSTIPIEEFYKNLQESSKEQTTQIKRRCDEMMVMTESEVKQYHFNTQLDKYEYLGKFPNIITEQFKKEQLTKEKALSMLNEMASFMQSATKKMAKIEPTLSQEMKDSLGDGYYQMSVEELANNPFNDKKK